jgi:hypothetical protein
MNDELLATIEREVLGWPGVSKESGGGGPGQGGFWVPPATVFRFGRVQLGHVHHDDRGFADFSFPREVRDELIRSGRAIPHPAFPDSRTTASYRIRGAQDVPGAVELFRMNYERAKSVAELREAAGRTRIEESRGETRSRTARIVAGQTGGTDERLLSG